MSHAEETLSKALREIERRTADRKSLPPREVREIHELARNGLCDAWDDERSSGCTDD